MTPALPVHLDSLGFAPRRSTHAAEWLPLYLEPIVGSGERICIGVIVADTAETIVCPVPALERLAYVYGNDAASAFILASNLAIESARSRILKYGFQSIREWTSPLEGLVLGHVTQGTGVNLLDVAHTALMQCSSLAARDI